MFTFSTVPKIQMCGLLISCWKNNIVAKNKNLTNTEEIDKHIFSPFFSYVLAMDDNDVNCV